MTLGPKALLLLLLLLLSLAAGAQTQEAAPQPPPLARSYVLKLSEDTPPRTIPLPEGYGAVQQPDGNAAMFFAPWNEYFNLVVAKFNQTDPAPIDSEARMTAELDAFIKANPSVEVVNRKQWMDAKGPRASFESFSGTKPKRKAVCNLAFPGAGHLMIVSSVGDESSLPDQRLIHGLLLKEINAQ